MKGHSSLFLKVSVACVLCFWCVNPLTPDVPRAIASAVCPGPEVHHVPSVNTVVAGMFSVAEIADGRSAASRGSFDLDVPYVPTSEKTVEAMLNLAEIRKGDIVCDPACGDGRLVISAAKKYNVRGVGTDLDPERIRESRANAKHAQVSDKVTFYEKNMFDLDFSETNVVLIYLLPSINLKLRPKLLTELKPGSRIVSHAFNMGEWKPDKTVQIDSSNVYCWVVPANVSGDWLTSVGPKAQPFSLTLSQQFQKVQGKITRGKVVQPLKNVELTGDTLTFSTRGEDGQDITFTGRVNGDKIQGTMEKQPGNKSTWEAKRNPSTKVPLEEQAVKVKKVAG